MIMWFAKISVFLYFLSLFIAQDTENAEIKFTSPHIPKSIYFAETIIQDSIGKKWILSQAKKDGISSEISKYDGKWSIEVPENSAIIDDYSLIMSSKARHHAISTKLDRPIKFDKNELVVQYEIKFQNGMECGGAYIKLISSSAEQDLTKFYDKTPFTIMFGPDKCGLDSKVHFIIRHKNPLTGQFEEKFVKSPKKDIGDIYNQKKSHLFTLVMRKDNTFEIYVNQKLSVSGNLLDDFDPPVNPPNEIDDPNDKKPEDWDEREKIPDSSAVKPDDWDESAPEFIIDEKAEKPIGWLTNEPPMINDPSAKMPEDWDSSIDGEWEPPKIENPTCKDADGCGEWKAPRIHNPSYKGKWTPPMIANPNYKGIWAPKKIPNPNYFEDKNPYSSLQDITALGLELWSMTEGVAFDNFFLSESKEDADKFAEETWKIKREAEEKNDPSSQSVIDYLKEVSYEKPWLVGIVVVGFLTLLVLIFYCLCKGGSDDDDEAPLLVDGKKKSEKDQYSPAGAAAALSKKSDVKEDGDNSDAKESSDVDYDQDDKTDSPEEIDISNKAEEKPQEEKVRKRKARKD